MQNVFALNEHEPPPICICAMGAGCWLGPIALAGLAGAGSDALAAREVLGGQRGQQHGPDQGAQGEEWLSDLRCQGEEPRGDCDGGPPLHDQDRHAPSRRGADGEGPVSVEDMHYGHGVVLLVRWMVQLCSAGETHQMHGGCMGRRPLASTSPFRPAW